MNKVECRKFVNQKLKLLLSQRKENAANAVLNKLSHLKDKKVLSFASMSKEVNVWLLNEKLKINNTLFLPKTFGTELKIFQIKCLSNLKKSSLGILEPDENLCSIVELNRIDVILVPGLGFDKNNNRLGRGKGFYDRLLSKFQGLKIGICFKEQVIDKIPVELHDQKVDQLYSF